MGKAQFAQKVEPQVSNDLDVLTKDYLSKGRIKENGDLLKILYNDHISLERKRQLYNQFHNADELSSHVSRIEEIFFQVAGDYQSRVAVMEKENEVQLRYLNQQILKLEEVVSIQRDQLKDKTIEIYEMGKVLKNLEKKLMQNEKIS